MNAACTPSGGSTGRRRKRMTKRGPPGLALSPVCGPIRNGGAARPRRDATGHPGLPGVTPEQGTGQTGVAQPVPPGRTPSLGGCQAWGCPHRPPLHSPQLARRALPIHTSPNCPLPSFLRSWRDSRGISHTSLVLTERSASLGVPFWHGTARRQHSPAARSAAPGRGGHRRQTPTSPLPPAATPRSCVVLPPNMQTH